ncbi:MAG: ABC transporter permease [Liquorilactobacillus hordei]|uniref:ABC transporter permease n=1 Tax=Liquorilactobacillus hordei TaxID=468911 RepID=UPI0039E8886E
MITENQQIWVVAKRIVKANLKSVGFWATVLVPLIFFFFGVSYLITPEKLTKVLITNHEANILLAEILPILLMFLSLIYSQILANEVVNDKTSRVMEFILAISSARAQLYGKILGTYILMVIHLLVYGIFIYSLADMTKFGFIIFIFSRVHWTVFGYLGINIILALYACLVWTAEIAAYVTDRNQLGIVVIPILAITAQCVFLAELYSQGQLNLPWGVARVCLNVVCAIPLMGSLLMPTLVFAQNFSIYEMIVSLVLQWIITALLLKNAGRQYQIGIISYKKVNPFAEAMRIKKKS